MTSLRGLALLLLLTGCATTPGVSTSLPLRKVVIYRNGVAYFEREGILRSNKLQFQVRPDHVGDFLATLAVMQSGGSSVRAASFPLHVEEPQGEDEESAPRREGKLSTVTLELAGSGRGVSIGYVAEQPVWKPSYRLVFEGEKPVLQAWGIVQNVSGEDWRDVRLSLIAGAPIAFRSTLGEPVTPQRPLVDDAGEVITAVPVGESSLAQASPPTSSMDAPKQEDAKKRERSAPRPLPSAPASPKSLGRSTYQPGSMAPRDVTLLATRSVQAGATRYDVPSTVTVPDQSATMVLLVSQEVPGEAVFMFAPEPGVPDSSRHPFRVARFVNSTGGLLERGPVAVFDDGNFLGQGVLQALSAGGEATVPFALERGIAVERDHRSTQLDARLAKIELGRLTVERDQVVRTLYRIRNGGEQAAKVVVRHPRRDGMRLHAPPAGTDDQVGAAQALVPASVAPRATQDLTVEERHPFSTQVDWFSAEADTALKSYVADERADAALVKALKDAWAIRSRIVQETEEAQKRRAEKAILERAAMETRENLRAIAKNKSGVAELKEKLGGRLLELDQRLAELSKRLVELELSLNEQRVRFNEQVRELKLSQPLPER